MKSDSDVDAWLCGVPLMASDCHENRHSLSSNVKFTTAQARWILDRCPLTWWEVAYLRRDNPTYDKALAAWSS